MPRDYARRRTYSPKRRQSPSIKLWLLTIGLIGLFVVGLSYLRIHTSVPSVRHPAAGTSRVSISAANATKIPKEKKVRFDFYTLLPENKMASQQTVNLKESEVSRASVEIAEQMTLRGKMQAPPQPASLPKVSAYVLQIAAFRQFEKADQLKAQLGLLGIESKIIAVKNSAGLWQRVFVGPYQDVETMKKMQKNLQEKHIKSAIVQIGG